MCMYDILMFLSLGGMFGVVGFLGAKMIENRKVNKVVKASHFYRKEGYQ